MSTGNQSTKNKKSNLYTNEENSNDINKGEYEVPVSGLRKSLWRTWYDIPGLNYPLK